MAVVPYRSRIPTGDEIRSVPMPVWVYLGLAVIGFPAVIASSSQFSLSLVPSAVAFVAPALFAAAIADVAPRERLARISAACFAIPVAVHVLAVLLLIGPISQIGSGSRDWGNLVPTLNDLVTAVSSVVWIVGIVAVAALALYIGRIQTRPGWVLLAVAFVLTAARFVYQASFVADQANRLGLILSNTPAQLLISPFTALDGIAWGLLLAITWERRMRLLALAAAIQLALTLFGLLTATVLYDWFQTASVPDPSTGFQLVVLIVAVAQMVFVGAMVLGIVRELPKHGQPMSTAERTSQ